MEKMTLEKATEMLDGGFHCSQCVLSHLAAHLGLDEKQALRLSAGLGGGCFHGGTCGAVTGAVITLGLVYGLDAPDDAKDALLKEKVHAFEARFEAENGALSCYDLLGGYDMSKPEDAAVISAKGLTNSCPAKCVSACAILDDMLKDVL